MQTSTLRKAFLPVLFLCPFLVNAQHKYYLSASGSDLNDGLSPTTAWQTVAVVNSTSFIPGDTVFFEGGSTFPGTINLQNDDNGSAGHPVVLTSYGTGKASIDGGNGGGLFAKNVSYIEVRKLIFKGNGISTNVKDGIWFDMDQTTGDLNHIYIDSVESHGFGFNGIVVGTETTTYGFSDVQILHSLAYDNGVSGISTYGSNTADVIPIPLYNNKNIRIAYSKAYNNLGFPAPGGSQGGNGIVISGTNGGVVEYCEAYGNSLNSSSGAPIGIWMYEVNNVVIQFCESHHNRSGFDHDGGGFDIDGGSQNSIIQYCYSHDNEGAGFALFQYNTPNRNLNNVIRYNISQNDGRNNNYSGLSLWTVDNSHTIENGKVYNNTVYVDNNNVVFGTPAGITISGKYSGTVVANNIFYVQPGVTLVSSLTGYDTTQVHFMRNNFYSASPVFNWDNITYTSLSNWKLGAPGQEQDMAQSFTFDTDPKLVNPGSGGIVHPADGGMLASITGYKLKFTSPLIDQGMSFSNMGTIDYYGLSIPQNGIIDIGASESDPASPLPVTIYSFSGLAANGYNLLTWNVGEEANLANYEVQRSQNGSSFLSIGIVKATNSGTYTFKDDAIAAGTTLFYRLKTVDKDGRFKFSTVLRLAQQELVKNSVSYDNGTGVTLRLNGNQAGNVLISIFDLSGKLLFKETRYMQVGSNNLSIADAIRWGGGVYIIKVSGTQENTFRFIK